LPCGLSRSELLISRLVYFPVGKVEREPKVRGRKEDYIRIERSVPLMAVFFPNMTGETTGLSAELDPYRPWLMWAGTPISHFMIPGK